MPINDVTQAIIEAAMKVHTVLGAGLLGRAYDACLAYLMLKTAMHFDRQVRVPVQFERVRLDCGLRAYLKLTGITVGLLIHVNVPRLRHGIKRLVNGYRGEDPLRPQRPLR